MKLIKNFVNEILEGKKTAQDTSHLEHQINFVDSQTPFKINNA